MPLASSTKILAFTLPVPLVLSGWLFGPTGDASAPVAASLVAAPQAPSSQEYAAPPPAPVTAPAEPIHREPVSVHPSSGRTPPLGEATDTAPGGIPTAALAAYQRAATVINAVDRGCDLDWQLLAAVGRIESDHGRFGGNVLGADGIARPGIYGVALDGGHGTAVISDTDEGRYDGDTKWDRAVGPMQFIPSTWSVVGVDADGDGRRNPQDIDDAALAAAVHLCSGAGDLSTERARRAALLRYNHSSHYVDLVLALAAWYADAPVSAPRPDALLQGQPVPSTGPPASDGPDSEAKDRQDQDRKDQALPDPGRHGKGKAHRDDDTGQRAGRENGGASAKDEVRDARDRTEGVPLPPAEPTQDETPVPEEAEADPAETDPADTDPAGTDDDIPVPGGAGEPAEEPVEEPVDPGTTDRGTTDGGTTQHTDPAGSDPAGPAEEGSTTPDAPGPDALTDQPPEPPESPEPAGSPEPPESPDPVPDPDDPDPVAGQPAVEVRAQEQPEAPVP